MRLRLIFTACVCACCLRLGTGVQACADDVATTTRGRPNVLFIAIDDLNDWVGCLGGHPQAATPNIDRLAERGMLFTNAHCAASLCNPSRASVLTGTLPTTNGVHGNQQDWRASPFLEGHLTLPESFRQHAYWTGTCGKIFHANHGGECGAMNGGHGGLRGFNHPASWNEAFPSLDQQLVRLPVPTGRNYNGLNIWHWDWGPIEIADEETEDGQAVNWATSVLAREHQEPFFLAVGIYKPHGPWYCPPTYFEQHQHEPIVLPNVPEDDLDDVPMIAHRGNLHRTVVEAGLFEDAVRAYLANVSFADAMVGRLLDALDSSDARDNTIVVLWSDHGWHLGEKHHWHKGTNWEEGTRVPIIISMPEMEHAGVECDEPVSLIDIYPTLLELCDLPSYERLDGLSLVPQLLDPATPRDRPAYTINNGRHQSVRTRQWRYIRYSDGSEELYDHATDPDEFHNLASQPEHETLKAELAAWFPEEIRRFEFENPPPYEDGFRLIFNGYDLNTWEGDDDVWGVQEDVIVGDAGWADGNNQLIWRGSTLSDFELRLRYRIAGEGIARIHTRMSMDSIQLRADGTTDADDWHDLTVISRGPRRQLMIDGEIIADVTDSSATPSEDYLVIDLDSECRLELKDMRIRN